MAYVLLTLSSLAFAGTWVAGKIAVATIAPMLIAAARFAIAVVGLIYLGVIGTALSFALVYEGINRIGVTRAAAFVHLIPVFGVGLSALILGEHVTWVTASPGAIPAPTP